MAKCTRIIKLLADESQNDETLTKKLYVMKQEYTVSINKISHYDLEYREMSVCFEHNTWEEALKEYTKCVASESAHASTLNSVRTDIVITMAHKTSIQYRVRIAN